MREPIVGLLVATDELHGKHEHFESLDETLVASHAFKHLREHLHEGVVDALSLEIEGPARV